MPTLAEIRFSIRDQLVGQIGNDDGRLRYQFIDKVIRDKRSLLVNSYGKRGMGVDQQFYSMLDCLTLQCGAVECVGVPSGIRHHYITVPEVEAITGSIAYLGNITGSVPFEERAFVSFMQAVPGRFGKTQPIFTVVGRTALVKYQPAGLEFIRLNAILTDPIAGSCRVTAKEEPYPIPNDKLHELELLVIKQLLATQPIQPDRLNDAADGTLPAKPVDTAALQ